MDEAEAQRFLPSRADAGLLVAATLRNGPYLDAVLSFLLKKDCEPLLAALAWYLGQPVTIADIDGLALRAEKHGACYHVARADVSVAGVVFPIVVNVAASPADRSILERDFQLLSKLGRQYAQSSVPKIFYKGAARYRDGRLAGGWLHMFAGQWFAGFHEFHLHRDAAAGHDAIMLWDLDHGYRCLPDNQRLDLYREAARILTQHYDPMSGRQIYPWKHAAGDFVARQHNNTIELRLITIRNYAKVVPFALGKSMARLLSLVYFLLHLTIQMRLDRLQGVGEMAWAEDSCLAPIMDGFFAGLAVSEQSRDLTQGIDLVSLLRDFSSSDWAQLHEQFLAIYDFSEEELDLIACHGTTHLDELQSTLALIKV